LRQSTSSQRLCLQRLHRHSQTPFPYPLTILTIIFTTYHSTFHQGINRLSVQYSLRSHSYSTKPLSREPDRNRFSRVEQARLPFVIQYLPRHIWLRSLTLRVLIDYIPLHDTAKPPNARRSGSDCQRCAQEFSVGSSGYLFEKPSTIFPTIISDIIPPFFDHLSTHNHPYSSNYSCGTRQAVLHNTRVSMSQIQRARRILQLFDHAANNGYL
jgi:hypothetical protein